MLADVVQSNFPERVKLPDCLRAVCDYLDAHGYPISGCFEICDWGRKDAAGWFRNDLAAQRQVAIFGRGSTGSSYALWLVPNANPDEAPIVLFGSEGEFIVLASNAFEFCRLLGLGYLEVESDDLTTPPSAWVEAAGLRDWLAERFSIDFPETGELACLGNPDPLGSTAAHPDFGWSTPDSSALRRPPRPVGYQGWWAHARRTQPASSAGLQNGDPGRLSRRLAAFSP